MCNWPRRRPPQSDDPAAQHEATNADNNHHNIEIAARCPVRHRANRKADHGNRNDDPVRPAKQRNKRRNEEKEGENADEDRDDIAHG